jgi:uncharacterized protein (DUF885 family)
MLRRILRSIFFLVMFCVPANFAIGAPQQPDLASPQSAMRGMIERFTADRASLFRAYTLTLSPRRDARLKEFYNEWLTALRNVDFDSLGQDGKVDYLLFQSHLTYELQQLAIHEKQVAEMTPLIPFGKSIIELDESRQRMELPKSEQAAAILTDMVKQISQTRDAAEAGMKTDTASDRRGSAPVQSIRVSTTIAYRAVAAVASLRDVLKNWFAYYNGYDPQFTWWVAQPYKDADKALETYGNFVREKLVGLKPDDKTAIIGDPVGREALMAELAHAMIPYTPEELIALSKNELAWCNQELIRASRELGYGDDWHKAVEHVKDMHVDPGQQPEAIRKLALEGIEYVESHDLVTVPPLAKEIWRMQMMTPERQLVNPFFTGGEVISVSYPTDAMTYEQRMMSMRGNNIPFSRSTVFHELIPGHHLQGFMGARYRAYRAVFGTPFFTEGNAFYWEMLLWDMGFPRTPEERIGMLFWRAHRCARVIFSLSFHLGLMTPQQCIEFLVKNVGHELDNAAAEVRRSFDGSVGPLYQCAYMLGALQFRAMHKEFVESGKMTNRAFHDALLKENRISVEMIRAGFTNEKLTRDFRSSWKFYGPIPAAQ